MFNMLMFESQSTDLEFISPLTFPEGVCVSPEPSGKRYCLRGWDFQDMFPFTRMNSWQN